MAYVPCGTYAKTERMETSEPDRYHIYRSTNNRNGFIDINLYGSVNNMSSLNGVALEQAYGRNQQTVKGVKADFEKGLDFRINAMLHPDDGRYCSIRAL